MLSECNLQVQMLMFPKKQISETREIQMFKLQNDENCQLFFEKLKQGLLVNILRKMRCCWYDNLRENDLEVERSSSVTRVTGQVVLPTVRNQEGIIQKSNVGYTT